MQSLQFDDVYFSREGGLDETRHVFIAGNNLPQAWLDKSEFRIGELGFGTGRNMLLTAQLFNQTASARQKLYLYSLERYPLTSGQLGEALNIFSPEFDGLLPNMLAAYDPDADWQCQLYPNVMLQVFVGDVRDTLPRFGTMDAWYLDGFAPAKNPDMWGEDICQLLAQHSRAGTTFATYTVAVPVQKALTAAGFSLQKASGFGRKREMMYGSF